MKFWTLSAAMLIVVGCFDFHTPSRKKDTDDSDVDTEETDTGSGLPSDTGDTESDTQDTDSETDTATETDTDVETDIEGFEETKILASDSTTYEFFGESAAVDGDWAIVGATQGFGAGSAYIFKYNDLGGWTEAQKLLASDTADGNRFGTSVDISGDWAIVGAQGVNNFAGAVYFFQKNASDVWEQKTRIASTGEGRESFGSEVSIDGNYAIVGASTNELKGTKTGVAYILELNKSEKWEIVQTLTASDPAPETNFGTSVGISGTYVIIGTSQEYGEAYIFEKDQSDEWKEVDVLISSAGIADDDFGHTTDISGDWAIVGASNPGDVGSTYLFKRSAEGEWKKSAKLTTPDEIVDIAFSASVSISGDRAVIGAPDDDENGENSGSAYLYERDEFDDWQLIGKFLASDGEESDKFGNSVSITEDWIIVGAAAKSDNGASSGAVYIY